MSEHGLCCVECHANGTAQGEHAGEMVERELIIKLLEELFDKAENAETRRLLTMAMARIKGEN